MNETDKITLIIILFAIIGIITVIKHIIKFILLLINEAFGPKIHEPIINDNYDHEYYKSKQEEINHKRMKENLQKAEQYRKDKWKDPYNP